jgi:hypothetical protein
LSGSHEDEADEEDEYREKRQRWLLCGGKDARISIWELMDFEKKKDPKGS